MKYLNVRISHKKRKATSSNIYFKDWRSARSALGTQRVKTVEAIRKHGPRSLKDLATIMKIPHMAAWRFANRLKRNGLIKLTKRGLGHKTRKPSVWYKAIRITIGV